MASDYDTAEAEDATAGEDVGKHGDLTRKLIAWVKQDMKHVREWRKEAKEDFAFYANEQWSDDDLKVLRAQNRPVITWNRIAPLVNAVVGSEINNRREVRYFAREPGDAKANEVLTAAGEWFRDECGAEDEESDAFKGCVIAGMGWTDTCLEFDSDPDGAPKIEAMDPMEMGWDCYAVKPNLADARRLWRIRQVSYEDAVNLTGVKDREKLHAAWVDSLDVPGQHDQDRADDYAGGQDDLAGDPSRKKCTLVEIRWLEPQAFYRGPDVMNPMQVKEYDERQYELAKKQFPDLQAVRQTRKVVRRAFIGKEVLGDPDQPMVPPGMFGWECITGYRDQIKGQWYGVVRAAKDPQRWSNKFFSQVMYLLNSQSKGGIIAERGAFEDDRQAEMSWAKADTITWAKAGALGGEKPKIMPKSPAQFPAGFFTLFQEAKESITDVTGLSAEFVGTREVDQAGVLEYQRKQSSLNLLAEIFNALRRYRKRQGRTMLYLIQNHLADGRLIRIVGDDLKQYVPLSRDKVADKTYDIIVDDSPTSPNEKDRTWQILMQMLPMVKDMITPDVAMELLALSPLPASLVEKLRGKAAEAAKQPKPPTPEEQKMQGEREKHQMDMAGKEMDLEAKQAEIGMKLEAKSMELVLKQQEMQMDAARDQQKLQMDMQRMAVQERQNAINQRKANTERTKAASE